MSEVVDEIVQICTEPKFMGKMVVILAGYERQLDDLLRVNPGLRSRFTEKVHFPDFTCEDACQLLVMQLEMQYSLKLSDEAQRQLPGLMEEVMRVPGWSNGRDVMTWVKRIFAAHSLASEEMSHQVPPGFITPVNDIVLKRAQMKFMANNMQPVPGPDAQGASPWHGVHMAPQYRQDKPIRPPLTKVDYSQHATSQRLHQEVADMDLDDRQDGQPQQQGHKRSFGGLSTEFLTAMQQTLEAAHFDLTSPNSMEQLAEDPQLALKVQEVLARDVVSLKSASPKTIVDMIWRWQSALKEQLQEEKEMVKKKRRPVWRCRICGRYGCPVSPYVERYEAI